MVRTTRKRNDFSRATRVYFKEWRKYRNLTQERACERIGIDRSHLSRIERGVDPYNEHTLTAMANAYRCEVADLFVRNPTDPEGIWSVWDRIPAVERPRLIEVMKAFARAGT